MLLRCACHCGPSFARAKHLARRVHLPGGQAVGLRPPLPVPLLAAAKFETVLLQVRSAASVHAKGPEAPVTGSSSRPATLLEWLVGRHGPGGIQAAPGFNRWFVPPAAISFHLCLGTVYSWSIFNAPLAKALGVVGPAAADWTLGSVVPVFSTAIFFLGLTSALAGRHLDHFGPRLFGLASALLWGGGHLLAAWGVQLHYLPLVYLGYGVLGGIGLGLGYLPPVTLLMSWFPDRRGMASGMAIMGFGGGAVAFTPLMQEALRCFRKQPQCLGGLGMPGQTVDASGVRSVSLQDGSVEVLAASSKELEGFPGLSEGLYAVGSGDVGLVATLASCGVAYLCIMSAAALVWRVPAPGWSPDVVASDREERLPAQAPQVEGVALEAAMSSPQFRYLWLNLCLNTTAGIGMIACAKDMMSEMFGSALPHIVTPGFATSYILAASVANMGGRFLWATVSDSIGRKNAYYTYFGLGVPLYLSLPCAATLTASDPFLALCIFYGATLVTFSTYGAGFSTMPPYVADVFGMRHTPAIFGRVLTAWSAAGVLGPLAITQLRGRAEGRAAQELATAIGEDQFLTTFGAPTADLSTLLASKAVTLQRLLDVAPAGTLDPTPLIYSEVMVVMAAVQGLALLSNSRIFPHPELSSAAKALKECKVTKTPA